MKILAWNIAEWEPEEIQKTIEHERPDIIIFTEYESSEDKGGEIKLSVLPDIYKIYKPGKKVCFCIHSMSILPEKCTVGQVPDSLSKRTAYLKVKDIDAVFYGVHLVDRLNYDDLNRFVMAQQAARSINNHFRGAGKEKSEALPVVIAGDFNIHPWEQALTHPYSFNATYVFNRKGPVKRIVPNRKLRREPENMKLYNPTWTLFSDGILKEGMKNGTFSYPNPKIGEFSWAFIDQVLISEEIIPKFNFDSLTVCKVHTKARPDRKAHFPLVFEINI